jgi:hypothetical protein
LEKDTKTEVMLAIIIPYYNYAFFEETLQSLARQTDQRFKVYIGDDYSPEKPTTLLEKYKGEFDFVYHRFESNLGGVSLSKQWERCIDLSKDEEWIMILGDDDYLGNNVIDEFYKNIKQFNKITNIVRFASKIIKQQLNSITEAYNHPVWEKASDSFFRKHQLLTRSSLSEYIFKRDSYNKFRFNNFPLAWYADDMAWLDFSERKFIFSINEALIFIRFSTKSISGQENNFIDKEISKFLFYKKLIKNQLSNFNTTQKKILLLEYGIIAKEQNQLNLKTCSYIAFQLIRTGSVYTLAKFIRRVFKAKFK